MGSKFGESVESSEMLKIIGMRPQAVISHFEQVGNRKQQQRTHNTLTNARKNEKIRILFLPYRAKKESESLIEDGLLKACFPPGVAGGGNAEAESAGCVCDSIITFTLTFYVFVFSY